MADDDLDFTPDEVQSYFQALHAALAAGPLVDLEAPVCMQFALGEAGTWVLRGAPDEAGSATLVEEGGSSECVDCTVSCSLTTLLEIASGKRRPMTALLRGLIKFSGNREVLRNTGCKLPPRFEPEAKPPAH